MFGERTEYDEILFSRAPILPYAVKAVKLLKKILDVVFWIVSVLIVLFVFGYKIRLSGTPKKSSYAVDNRTVYSSTISSSKVLSGAVGLPDLITLEPIGVANIFVRSQFPVRVRINDSILNIEQREVNMSLPVGRYRFVLDDIKFRPYERDFAIYHEFVARINLIPIFQKAGRVQLQNWDIPVTPGDKPDVWIFPVKNRTNEYLFISPSELRIFKISFNSLLTSKKVTYKETFSGSLDIEKNRLSGLLNSLKQNKPEIYIFENNDELVVTFVFNTAVGEQINTTKSTKDDKRWNYFLYSLTVSRAVPKNNKEFVDKMVNKISVINTNRSQIVFEKPPKLLAYPRGLIVTTNDDVAVVFPFRKDGGGVRISTFKPLEILPADIGKEQNNYAFFIDEQRIWGLYRVVTNGEELTVLYRCKLNLDFNVGKISASRCKNIYAFSTLEFQRLLGIDKAKARRTDYADYMRNNLDIRVVGSADAVYIVNRDTNLVLILQPWREIPPLPAPQVVYETYTARLIENIDIQQKGKWRIFTTVIPKYGRLLPLKDRLYIESVDRKSLYEVLLPVGAINLTFLPGVYKVCEAGAEFKLWRILDDTVFAIDKKNRIIVCDLYKGNLYKFSPVDDSYISRGENVDIVLNGVLSYRYMDKKDMSNKLNKKDQGIDQTAEIQIWNYQYWIFKESQ